MFYSIYSRDTNSGLSKQKNAFTKDEAEKQIRYLNQNHFRIISEDELDIAEVIE